MFNVKRIILKCSAFSSNEIRQVEFRQYNVKRMDDFGSYLEMLPEIIIFNKSFQCRLEEFRTLLDCLETPCSEVTEIWASIFKDFADLGLGWEALWILSEESCRKYHLFYPTAVIVNVNEINLETLTASVSVLAVQEDIDIPSVLEVSLIDVHPIKAQDYDDTDLMCIEDWLDKCRFFFKYLWYPWDAKINVSMMDWCEAHLKNRLTMHYDIKNGMFNKSTETCIKLLLAEARNTSFTLDNNFPNEDERLTTVKKYITGKILKTELNLLENPDLRYGMILLKKKEKFLQHSLKEAKCKVNFVWKCGKCEALIKYLKVAKLLINEETEVKICETLQDALNSSDINDLILLPPGVYTLSALRGIGNGGTIKGLEKNESLIVPDSSTVAKAILLQCFGPVEFENLIISKAYGITIQVSVGTVHISNCKIISNEKNSTSKGIVVASGTKIFIKDCEIKGFGTGIVLQVNTHASILNTKIIDCFEGIKVAESSSFSLHDVEVKSCSTFGIRVESSKIDSKMPLIGDITLLEEYCFNCKVIDRSVAFFENKKGDVVVKKSDNLFVLKGPSESDVSNEVICITDESSSDETSVNEIQTSFDRDLFVTNF